MSQVCCPQCRSEKLSLIGGMLISPEGVPYKEGLHLADIAPEKVHVAREFLRCDTCRMQFKLADGQAAAGIDVKAALWEVTEHGVRVPIICPRCGNQDHFVRSVLELVRKDEDVLINDGKAEVQFIGGGVVVDHRAVLTYACGEDGCTGEIALFSNEFHIVHTN